MIRKLKDFLFPAAARRRREREFQAILEADAAHDDGFHGDTYVMELADLLIGRSAAFVETGLLAGTTSLYVGRKHGLPVYSCEPDPQARAFASTRCRDLPNVTISDLSSPEFLHALYEEHPELAKGLVTFWLDAHGYGFKWPLVDEVRFITSTLESGFVMIDDFRVPGRPEFGFDRYRKQVCDLDFIRPGLAPREYALVMPTYREKTAPVHGLRGVGVLVFGVDDFALPEGLGDAFSVEVYRP
jgi:hypothetical protein